MGIIGGGAQFQKKRFSTMGEGNDVRPSVMSDDDRERLANEDNGLVVTQAPAKSIKQLIPFGNRILVRKKKVGDKLGSGLLVAPDSVAEHDTDLAIVIYVPDQSFIDKELIANAENIIKGLSAKAQEGNDGALNALMTFNAFLRTRGIKPGDEVLISKYAGISFHDNNNPVNLTLCNVEDIIGVVVKQ